ncbi:MAG: lytic transglycosylase domain-containing protein [Fimbriimonadaceae bacterium]
MRRANWILVLAVMASLPAIAVSQALPDYLQLREKHGVLDPAGVEALETLIGERILEVTATLKGKVGGVNRGVLILSASDQSDIMVHYEGVSLPMVMAEPFRLLISAKREHETALPEFRLLAAISEEEIAPWETQELAKRRAEAEARAKQDSRANSTLSGQITPRGVQNPSRSGPAARAPGAEPPPLYMSAREALPYYAAFIANHNKKLPAGEPERIAQAILGFSQRYGVDARLVMAMVIAESDFRPQLVSSAGAMGIAQLMPATVRNMGVRDPFDSVENLGAAVRIIRGHLERYGKQTGNDFEALVLTLAAYNAGSGAVRRHGGVPPFKETQNYIRRVTTWYRRLSGQE